MRHVLHILSILMFSCTLEQEVSVLRPNILLIVADDLGYTDLGSYGGDIETPVIDRLAGEGILFTRFHASPYCAVTRAMLLSGNDNHIAGMGVQGLRTKNWGYEGKLTDRVVPIQELLLDNGYHTYMVGKWHLGNTLRDHPAEKGFERSFCVRREGAANHYSAQGVLNGELTNEYLDNGKITNWPEGAYSTDFYTDKLIEFIEKDVDSNKPFFAYAAYTSPHWPLQVDERYWRKYTGRYDEGYEVLRSKRLETSKKAGLVPPEASLPPLHPSIIPWDSLDADRKKIESRKMELYAGMVDNLDTNIGRLLDYLEKVGELENTLIIFMSDNGAAAEDFYYHPRLGPTLQTYYTDSYEEMGKEKSYISYGPQWAEAGSSPFKYYKSYTTEGGITTPMIIAGMGIDRNGIKTDVFTTLLDIAPTLYEITGTQYPSNINNRGLYPLLGKSMLPFMQGNSQNIHDSTYVFAIEHAGKAMLRKGDWKITHHEPPFSLEKFALYNLKEDIGETRDLKEEYPEKYNELLQEWNNYATRSKIQQPYPGDEDF